MSKLTVTCSDFKPLARNTLRGFAMIHITEMRMVIHDVAIHQKGDARWAQLPAKHLIDKAGVALRDKTTGKINYSNIIEFADRATRDAFLAAVIAAVLKREPTAFDLRGEAA
jgi:hypothetical protein